MLDQIKEIQKSVIEARVKIALDKSKDAVSDLMKATKQIDQLRKTFEIYTQWMEDFNSYNKKKECQNVQKNTH